MAAAPQGSAARRFLAGMARCAALYCRKIRSRPTAFRKHRRALQGRSYGMMRRL